MLAARALHAGSQTGANGPVKTPQVTLQASSHAVIPALQSVLLTLLSCGVHGSGAGSRG